MSHGWLCKINQLIKYMTDMWLKNQAQYDYNLYLGSRFEFSQSSIK